MAEALHKVAALRRTLLPLEEPRRLTRVALGHDDADLCLDGGLVRASLHEVFAAKGHAPAAIGFALGLAARASGGRHLFWIRQDFAALEQGEIAGSGVQSLGLPPSRLLLLRVADAKSALRAAADGLSCASLGAVLIELSGQAKVLDLTARRRLSLAAAAKGVTAILLRLDATPEASAAETRWHVRAAPSSPLAENWGAPCFDAELTRHRHGGLGRWTMQWDIDHGCFASENRAPAHPRAVAQAASDRQDREKAQGLRKTG